jgi:hypothetical protein
VVYRFNVAVKESLSISLNQYFNMLSLQAEIRKKRWRLY